MPSVTGGPSGGFTLAYLSRAPRGTSWRLCLAALSLDGRTGKPVTVRLAAPTEELSNGLRSTPPTFSSDGAAVFASTEDGRIKRYSLARLASRRRPLAID